MDNPVYYHIGFTCIDGGGDSRMWKGPEMTEEEFYKCVRKAAKAAGKIIMGKSIEGGFNIPVVVARDVLTTLEFEVQMNKLKFICVRPTIDHIFSVDEWEDIGFGGRNKWKKEYEKWKKTNA